MRSSSTLKGDDLDAAVASAQRDDVLIARAEAKAAFHMRMRARGVQDLAVLRAFEIVPRAFFVPSRHVDLATRGLPVPIGCGQTLPEPWFVARMIEALRLEDGSTVLEIGTGTGYATAILSLLAASVTSIERFRGLTQAARDRLSDLGLVNATVLWGDGLAPPEEGARFDRIIAHGLVAEPDVLLRRLKPGGVLVCALASDGAQTVTRLEAQPDGPASRTTICPARLQPLVKGAAAAL